MFVLFGLVFFTTAGSLLLRFAAPALALLGIDEPILVWIPLAVAAVSAGPIAARVFDHATRQVAQWRWQGACVGLYAVLVGIAVLAAQMALMRHSAGGWLLVVWAVIFVAGCGVLGLPAMLLGAAIGAWCAGAEAGADAPVPGSRRNRRAQY